MPNHRIDLEYDGTDFHGWQIQPGKRTVQGELERALAVIFDEEIRLVGAGRTDAGVHAAGQVASFVTTNGRRPEAVRRALDALLPRDVRVLGVRIVPDGFSARHSALARSYRYQMLRGASVFSRRFFLELHHDVDASAMEEAAALLVGEHDFTAFAASDAGTSCDCLVHESRVTEARAAVLFDITAKRFLHHMVRRLAGLLVEVGRGRVAPRGVEEILRARDRGRGGPRLPPQGLVLVGVRYPGEAESPDGCAAPGAEQSLWLGVPRLPSGDA